MPMLRLSRASLNVVPFVILARWEHAVSDPIERDGDVDLPAATAGAASGRGPDDGDPRT